MHFDYPVNILISTEKNYNKVLELLEEDGVTWASGKKPTELSHWKNSPKLCVWKDLTLRCGTIPSNKNITFPVK